MLFDSGRGVGVCVAAKDVFHEKWLNGNREEIDGLEEAWKKLTLMMKEDEGLDMAGETIKGLLGQNRFYLLGLS